MQASPWNRCIKQLQTDLSEQQFNTWIRPIQVIDENGVLRLLAPNRYVADWVKSNCLEKIHLALGNSPDSSSGEAGDSPGVAPIAVVIEVDNRSAPDRMPVQVADVRVKNYRFKGGRLNKDYTFDNFVEGKSNQMARAAATQVAMNPGGAYNPLFIYGGTGLGKTHLMQSIGHLILEKQPDAQVAYVHSEQFVGDMVKSLQHNTINEFKANYRSLDALLIDDIQFFAGKERSQEEFFHTFNALFEGQRQIVLTCDRYPKEVSGLEDRLKSRFGWGLTVAVEPPELETSVAILMSKATADGADLPEEVAFFIAKKIRSNVRELEGALHRVIMNSEFTGRPITLDFAKEALRDLLAVQDRLVTIDNIQKTVAEYFKIRVADLHSKRRSRSITRPRQIAMSLAKELTSHSLPEIGDAFGGRDHTTVIHACRRIKELREMETRVGEDYKNLLRTLSG